MPKTHFMNPPADAWPGVKETVTPTKPMSSPILMQPAMPILARFAAWATKETVAPLFIFASGSAAVPAAVSAMAITDPTLTIADARRAVGPARQVPSVLTMFLHPSSR